MSNKPFIRSGTKGFLLEDKQMSQADLAAASWNILADDLPFPIAVLKREALEHNVAWMQAQAIVWGVDLAPHGKTTMSPELFQRQLAAGAWGMTFATVHQLAVGVAAGVQRALIANQLVQAADLAAVQRLRREHAGLRVVFLVDSLAQLALIEAWHQANASSPPFEVLLELGVPGGRSGLREHEAALELARALHRSAAVALVGIECYEGLGVTGNTEDDEPMADALMARFHAVAGQIDAEQLFDADEVLLSAGGSSIFDLVATRLRPRLGRPVRGLLRSGCYITHDHGFYRRAVATLEQRCGCQDTLRPALEVWALVQSCPEPGLALLNAGRRDLSFDMGLPVPIARAPRGQSVPSAVPASWRITALNDQHAYLRWDASDAAVAPVVGERVGLGISHPCTTFDKWRWMPVVEDDYRVSDAVRIEF